MGVGGCEYYVLLVYTCTYIQYVKTWYMYYIGGERMDKKGYTCIYAYTYYVHVYTRRTQALLVSGVDMCICNMYT